MFGRLFGGGKKNVPVQAPIDLNTSIQKLRQAIQTLDKREEHLQKKLRIVLIVQNKNPNSEIKKAHCMN